MSDISCPCCGAPYASKKARAKYEALMAAATALNALGKLKMSTGIWQPILQAIAALRAAGIHVDEP